MLLSARLFAPLALAAFLVSCGPPAPSGGGAGSPVAATQVEQGDGILLRKEKVYRPFSDTTVILLDSSNKIRVNDVIFQGEEFNRLIVNHWEGIYQSDSTLPTAFRVDFEREVYMGQRGSIYDAIVRAQDTVRHFIMQKEGIDSAAANRKYPVLGQRPVW